jgi:peroxiredoxin
MRAKIENVNLTYKGQTVNAKEITVISILPMSIETAWGKLQESQTLEFVTKGMMKFEPLNGQFPKKWEIGKTYPTRNKLYGFIPAKGIHNVFFESKDEDNFIIKTKEGGDAIKVWNHTMQLKKVSENEVEYTDKIVIYNGKNNGFMAWWTKRYYQYRQKRWRKM